jgi:transcriptional regulator with XRE-family HTH domain
MNFNEKLQALRKEKGLTQEELAEKLDVSRQAVSKWEAGQAMPEIDNLIGLANIYGVSMDYLLTGKEFEDTSAPKIQIVHVKPKISIRVLTGSVLAIAGVINLNQYVLLSNDNLLAEVRLS